MTREEIILGKTTEKALSGGFFRGAVIRIEKAGDLVFENSWGNALWEGEVRVPMQRETLFDLASLTKIFTSTAVLRLSTLKYFSVDTSVAGLMGFNHPGLRDSFKGLTIENLLDHSSGLHYWYPFYAVGRESFEEILELLIEEKPPENKTVYSDLNYIILGLVIQRVTGKALPEAMRDLVFTPLGLKSATYTPSPEYTAATEFGNRIEMEMVSRLGLNFGRWRGTDKAFRGTCDDGNAYYYFGGAAGQAGIFSDAADVARLGSLYLECGEQKFPGYLDPGIRSASVINRGHERGYGFQFGPLYPEGGFGHTGFTGTYIYINPETGITVAALTNRLHVPKPVDINSFRKEIAEKALALFA